jgi:hypothetical protein
MGAGSFTNPAAGPVFFVGSSADAALRPPEAALGPRQLRHRRYLMIDREKVVIVLRKRFPSAAVEDIAAAANAIVGLGDEWEEVAPLDPALTAHMRRACGPRSASPFVVGDGTEFRLLRRR